MANQEQRRRGRKVPQSINDISTDDMPPLPDTSTWVPRNDKAETLQGAFLKRCISLEDRIKTRVKNEKEMNLDNYDSGPGVEDIFREELNRLLPGRYAVRAGVINDRYGKSAGDCDLIIFNNLWFPAIKPGATDDSRRFHFPIEGVYSVIEIKQSINYEILDQAMKKLVSCHRLHRPPTGANRLIENREYDDCFHGLTNPLYSAIVAVDLDKNIDVDRLVDRFFLINRTLKRLEVVRCLCVLGHGTVTWGFVDQNEVKPTKFMREDIFNPIMPTYQKVPDVHSALYAFLSDLLLHLYQSVLGAEDIAIAYGPKEFTTKLPSSPEIVLPPDSEWMEKLKHLHKSDSLLIDIAEQNKSNELQKRKK